MHNPSAGTEKYNAEKLVSLLKKAGHYVIYQSVKEKNYPKALQRRVDLILAAGGDGTIKKIALAAVDTVGNHTPIGILMLGTANNLAKTLGLDLPPKELIASLAEMRPHPFDIGRGKAAGKEFKFIEGLGSGFFAEFLNRIIHREKKGKESDIFELLRRRALKQQPAYYEINRDGKDMSGEYLLVEAMNIKSIGANLAFAPNAKTDDGHLELVMATEENREGILKSLDNADETSFSLPVRRFRHLQIRLPSPLIHVDDKTQSQKEDVTLEIEVLPGALSFLVP